MSKYIATLYNNVENLPQNPSSIYIEKNSDIEAYQIGKNYFGIINFNLYKYNKLNSQYENIVKIKNI